MGEHQRVVFFEAVLQETLRFRDALPGLLPNHRGQWVVFKDGHISSTHQDEDDAYRAGMLRYGRNESYIVDRVERKNATPLSATVVYG